MPEQVASFIIKLRACLVQLSASFLSAFLLLSSRFLSYRFSVLGPPLVVILEPLDWSWEDQSMSYNCCFMLMGKFQFGRQSSLRRKLKRKQLSPPMSGGSYPIRVNSRVSPQWKRKEKEEKKEKEKESKGRACRMQFQFWNIFASVSFSSRQAKIFFRPKIGIIIVVHEPDRSRRVVESSQWQMNQKWAHRDTSFSFLFAQTKPNIAFEQQKSG